MGEGSKYKVVKLTDKEVEMIPLKANNDILWTHLNDTTWTALLSGKTDTVLYTLNKLSPEQDSALLKINRDSN